MFYYCKSLTSLYVTNFNTQNVTNMAYIFGMCGSLTSLDVNHNMEGFFLGDKNLISIDLSSFQTKKVKKISSMFQGCSLLNSINLSNFNTINIEEMNNMFSDCSNLKYLDISSFRYNNSYKYKSYNQIFNKSSSSVNITIHKSFYDLIKNEIPLNWIKTIIY